MDKRANKRIKIHQLARVCGKMGVMNNISLDGLEVSTSLLPKTRKIDICFEVFGEEIKILGLVQWFRRKNSIKSLNELGIQVKEAPPQYYQFVSSLV
ncbi:MAG: hypothetical protein MUF15_24455 [Acidobacteria bacterium]|jgi:hypothetical protein|nr:hypothetical protein [Acidobacteriota bacterium]